MMRINLIADGKRLFAHHELACRCCDLVKLALGFGAKLIELRLKFGLPMFLNSCCRCPEHNKDEKGHKRSLHLTENPVHETGGTCGIDVERQDDAYNAKLVEDAWELGWSVGISDGFIHLDRRSDYTDLIQHMFYYAGYTGKNFDYVKEL